MKVARAAGELVLREAVERAMGDAVNVILSRLENLPSRLAPELLGCVDLDTIEAKLKAALDDYRRDVADGLDAVARKVAASDVEVLGLEAQRTDRAGPKTGKV